MAKITETTFQLYILSPYKKFYQGNAVSLSATNEAGDFDVLAGHTNFFSLLMPGIVRVNTGGTNLDIPIESGLLIVSHDNVTLFVDIL